MSNLIKWVHSLFCCHKADLFSLGEDGTLHLRCASCGRKTPGFHHEGASLHKGSL